MFSHLAQFLPEQWSLVGHLPSIPHCSKCNLPIDADLHMIKISPDQLFHTHCALCSVCAMSLFPSPRGGCASAKCFQRNGRLFCSTHYFEFFAPRCAGCQSPILPHEFAYKLKTELIFHMGCLRCAFCGELLGKGAQIVFDAQHRSVICAKHQRWSLTGQTQQKPVANAEANCGTNFSSCVPSNNVQKSSTEVELEHDDDTALFIGQQYQMDCATMPTSFRLPMATSAEPEDLQLGCCARGQSGGELSQEGACTSAISPPNSPQLENCSPSIHPEKAAKFGCTASSAEGATRNKPKARTDSDQSAGSSTGGARGKRTTTPVPVLQYPFEMYAAGEQFARQEEDAQQSAMGAKRRGPRTTISQRQLDILNHIFAATPKPSKHARAKLALDAGLSMRVIQVWFQNRRSKERRLKHLCNFLRHCDTQSDSAEMKREAMEEDEDQQEQ